MVIAETVLSIVKEREEEKEKERLKDLEKVFLEELSNNFKRNLEQCVEISSDNYELNFTNYKLFTKRDLLLMCKRFGVEIVEAKNFYTNGMATVRIPETKQDSKLDTVTIAQEKRDEFNKKISDEKEAKDRFVDEICQEAFEKLKTGDFEYSLIGYEKCYITLKMNISLSKEPKYVVKQIKKRFEKNGFSEFEINDRIKVWSFTVKKNKLF